jgi:plastocyanin
MLRVRTPALAGILLGALAACSGSSSPTTPTTPSQPGGGTTGGTAGGTGGGTSAPQVSVMNNFYQPANISVTAGTTVTWTWASGGVSHSVTFDDGSGGSQIQGSGSFNRTFNAAGSFAYHCLVHGQAMAGTVTVTAASTGTAGSTTTGGSTGSTTGGGSMPPAGNPYGMVSARN